MTRPAPSRKDRRGVKRRRARADVARDVLGRVIPVANRGGDVGMYFSALTRVDRDTIENDPRYCPPLPGRWLAPRGAAGKRDAIRRAQPVEVLCRCESRLVTITVGLDESGYQPRCNPTCEVRRRKRRGEDAR